MICKNCGANIAEESAFCGFCGSKVTVEAEENFVNADDNIQENPQENVQEDTCFDDNSVAEFLDEQPEIKPKKKIKIPKKVIFIGATAIVLVVAIILNWYVLGGFFVKWFGSDSDYLAYVEKANAENGADAISEMYGEILSAISNGEISADTNMKVTIGDKAFEIIETQFGISKDQVEELEFLKEADLNFNVGFESFKMQYQFGLGLNGKDIIKCDCFLDIIEGDTYFGLPGLSDEYLKTESDSELDEDEITETIDSIVNSIPSESDINDLLEKYIGVAFECITDDYVNMSDGTIEANGIEQDCTVIEIEVTDKLILEFCKTILEEAEDDEDIDEIVDKIEDVVNDIAAMNDADDINLSDEFSDGLSELIKDVEEELDNIEDEKVLFCLTDYIDGTHNIIGRKVEIERYTYEYDSEEETYNRVSKGMEEVFFCGKAEDGEIGYECWVNVDGVKIQLIGTGSESWWSEAITGEFELIITDKEKEYYVLTFETEDLDCYEITDELSGIIKIYPGEDFADVIAATMGKSTASVVKSALLLEPSIEIKLDNSSDSANNSISILLGDDLLLKLDMQAKIDDDASVSIPEKGDIVDSEDSKDWLNSLDFGQIVDNLEDAGVPSEWANSFLEGFEDSFKQTINGSSNSSDYNEEYYEYDYSY